MMQTLLLRLRLRRHRHRHRLRPRSMHVVHVQSEMMNNQLTAPTRDSA